MHKKCMMIKKDLIYRRVQMVKTIMRTLFKSEVGVILSSPSATSASIDLTHLTSMCPSSAGGLCSAPACTFQSFLDMDAKTKRACMLSHLFDG